MPASHLLVKCKPEVVREGIERGLWPLGLLPRPQRFREDP